MPSHPCPHCGFVSLSRLEKKVVTSIHQDGVRPWELARNLTMTQEMANMSLLRLFNVGVLSRQKKKDETALKYSETFLYYKNPVYFKTVLGVTVEEPPKEGGIDAETS